MAYYNPLYKLNNKIRHMLFESFDKAGRAWNRLKNAGQQIQGDSLPETKIALENGRLEDYFFFWILSFQALC